MDKNRYLTLALCTFGIAAATTPVVRHAAQNQVGGAYRVSTGAGVSPLARALRPNYPYSAIPGGAYTPAELRSAIARDGALREHYAGFDLTKLRLVTLQEEHYAFVSYRQNGRFYWTKRRLKIPRGEVLLTDGVHYAKTRCGNRLSDSPAGPTQISNAAEAKLSPPLLTIDGLSGLSFLPSPEDPAEARGDRPPVQVADEKGSPFATEPFASEAATAGSSSKPLLPDEQFSSFLNGGADSAGAGSGDGSGGGSGVARQPVSRAESEAALLPVGQVAPVPEPSSWLLCSIAFGVVIGASWRFKGGGSRFRP